MQIERDGPCAGRGRRAHRSGDRRVPCFSVAPQLRCRRSRVLPVATVDEAFEARPSFFPAPCSPASVTHASCLASTPAIRRRDSRARPSWQGAGAHDPRRHAGLVNAAAPTKCSPLLLNIPRSFANLLAIATGSRFARPMGHEARERCARTICTPSAKEMLEGGMRRSARSGSAAQRACRPEVLRPGLRWAPLDISPTCTEVDRFAFVAALRERPANRRSSSGLTAAGRARVSIPVEFMLSPLRSWAWRCCTPVHSRSRPRLGAILVYKLAFAVSTA